VRRKLTRVALVAAAFAACAVPGASVAGMYVPPPGDTLPVWSPDGSRVAFLTSRSGQALAEVPAAGGPERRLVEGVGAYTSQISPDWRWVAFTRFAAGGQSLWISRLDGTEEHALASSGFGAEPAWSPDSRRLVFRQADGSFGLVEIESGLVSTLVPSGGSSPAWSPDGTRIAFAGGGEAHVPDLYVVSASGGVPRLLAGGPGAQLEPSWSPDGDRLAFLTQAGDAEPFRIGIVRADGTGRVSYPGPGVSNAGSFAWMPGSEGIVFADNYSQGILLLDLESGKVARLATFGATPAPSPDGSLIAFSSGGECRDRSGIYVMRADARRVQRLTNDCRVIGTPDDDVLRGTGLADVVLGLRGNDRLFGLSAGYVGDTLRGGEGDDVLIGTFTGDLLRGDAGADRLFGGLSADTLYGSAGEDRMDAQAGRDFVHARDRERDVVLCGTNHGTTPERDEAWVDRFDVVRGCEIVHRRVR
jgi:Tol biopolymer transport system component